MYKDKKIVLLFLFPAVLLIIAFLYWPFILSIINSFFKINFFGAKGVFIGIDNYKEMFSDPAVGMSVKNTLYLMAAVIIFQVGFALVLALMVSAIKAGQHFFRTVFFFPVVISATALGLLFVLMYDYSSGALNQLMVILGKEPVWWLNENNALLGVSIPVLWQYVGFYFVILLTAINKIPDELYESAYLEGIREIKKAYYITIPLIWDVIKAALILAITGALRVFDLVWVISRGGPQDASQLLGTYMYKQAFESSKIGYASAVAVLIVVLGLVLSMVSRMLTAREEITY